MQYMCLLIFPKYTMVYVILNIYQYLLSFVLSFDIYSQYKNHKLSQNIKKCKFDFSESVDTLLHAERLRLQPGYNPLLFIITLLSYCFSSLSYSVNQF